MLRGRLVLGAGLGLLIGGVAEAQTIDADSVIELAPVSVTVLRTPLEMEQVPYAVSVNNELEIQRGKPGISVEEALRIIPGVQVDNRFNPALGERIAVRGFGARSQFGVRGVRLLVDGIPATLPDGQSSLTHVDVKSLGRVEVVRGPAAALYGNTAGGVIQMETEAPPRYPISQEFSAIGGSYGMLRLQSTTAGSSQNVGYALNFSRLSTDGYRQHSSATNLFLNGRLSYDGGRDRFRVIFGAGDTDAQNPGSLSAAQQEDDRYQAYSSNLQFQTGKTVSEGTLGASWSRDVAPGELEFAGYLLQRDVVNPIPNNIVDLGRVAGGLRTLFRSNEVYAERVQVSVGAEADRQQDDRREYGNDGGERGSLGIDQFEKVSNVGIFSQVSIRPFEPLTLLAGLRYDWFDFSVQDYFLSDGDQSGDRTLDALSPSVGAVYAVNDDVQFYGNIGQTFETPTTVELGNQPDGRGGLNRDLEPQEATSYEIGTRLMFAQRVAVQFAAYRSDVSNSLIPFEVEGQPGINYFRNAGSATHQGIEVGLTLVPIDQISIQSAYSLTDAEFDDYIVGTNDYSGLKVPGVAPSRLETVVTFSDPGTPLYASVENRYVARTAANDANTGFSPSYNITELRAGVDGISIGRHGVDLFAGVSNLFDAEYNTSLAVNAFGGRFFEAGPPRSFYVGGNVRINAR